MGPYTSLVTKGEIQKACPISLKLISEGTNPEGD